MRLGIPFQNGSVSWLLVEGLSFSLWDCMSGFLQWQLPFLSEWLERKRAWFFFSFYLVLEVSHHHFYHILLIGSESLSTFTLIRELIYTSWVEEHQKTWDVLLETTIQYKWSPGWKKLHGQMQRQGVGKDPAEMAAGARQHACILHTGESCLC